MLANLTIYQMAFIVAAILFLIFIIVGKAVSFTTKIILAGCVLFLVVRTFLGGI